MVREGSFENSGIVAGLHTQVSYGIAQPQSLSTLFGQTSVRPPIGTIFMYALRTFPNIN